MTAKENLLRGEFVRCSARVTQVLIFSFIRKKSFLFLNAFSMSEHPGQDDTFSFFRPKCVKNTFD